MSTEANKKSTKVLLQDVRGSYVYLTSPRKNDDGTDGSYSIQVLIPKDHPQLKEIEVKTIRALVAKFGEAAGKKPKMYKLPLRDGDEERDGEEYKGMMFMNVNGGKKPGIVNRAGVPADEDDLEALCYSGAKFHVSMNLYGFDNESKGVAAGLNNVMLRKAGERLDGRVAASDEFSEFADDSDGFGDDDFGDDEAF